MSRSFRGFSDEQMLARIIEAEAAREPLSGKVAVASVIDNRRKSGGYGDGWKGVITKPGQFSAINDVTGYAKGQGANSLFWKKPSAESLAVARYVMGGKHKDPTGGATHYFNPDHADPKWARGKEFSRIGNHVFGNANAGRTMAGGGGADKLMGGDSPVAAAKAELARRKALAAAKEELARRKGAASPGLKTALRPLSGSESVNNPDGSVSTERTITVYMPDGAVANIPTLWIGEDGKVKELGEEDAIRAAVEMEKTGGAFPRFDGIEPAVAAARARSEKGGRGVGPLFKPAASPKKPGAAAMAMGALKEGMKEMPAEDEPGFLERAQIGLGGMINDYMSGAQQTNPAELKFEDMVGKIVTDNGQQYVEFTQPEYAQFFDVDPRGRATLDQFNKAQFLTQVDPRSGETVIYQKTDENAEKSPLLNAGRMLGVGATATIPGGSVAKKVPVAIPQATEAADAAKRIGVTPSLGMGGPGAGRVASAMEGSAIMASPVRRDASRAVGEIAKAREGIAATAGPGVGRIDAGNALREGAENFIATHIKGQRPGGRLPITRQLLNNVEKKIPVGTNIDVSEAAGTLRSILDEFPSLKNTAKDLGISKWQPWLDDIEAAGGQLTWQETRALRTMIGEQIGKLNSVLGDRSSAQVKRIYGALSDDLGNAARKAGPEAEMAWNRYNKHFQRSATMADEALDIILKTDNPEGVFEKFTALAKDRGSRANVAKLKQIKSAIPEEAWGRVVSSVVRRMGQKGDDFSPAQFVTEWQKFSPEAKELLFAGKKVPKGLMKQMNDLVKVAGQSKGAEQLINHSRSGANLTNIATATAGAGALAAGDVITAGLAALGMRASAELLTHPAFLRAFRTYVATGGGTLAVRRVKRLVADNPQLSALAYQAGRTSAEPRPQTPAE